MPATDYLSASGLVNEGHDLRVSLHTMAPQHHIRTELFPTISYRRVGSGPVLMLLHGFPANGSLWDQVSDILSADFTLLIPDLPGTGTSELGAHAVSIEQMSSVVPAILDDAELQDCVLAGHSMGGYIGMAALSKYRDRIRGLSLVHSTAAADDEPKREKRAKSIALINNGGREPFVKGMMPGLFSPATREAHPGLISHWTAEGLKVPAASLTTFYQAMMERPDRSAELRDLPVPIQFLLGEEDSTIPWRTVTYQTILPYVSFIERYPDTGHMGMLECPERMAADLSKFVNYCQ
jgi:pimeloyl-ACP methyl ester carboxylesterase